MDPDNGGGVETGSREWVDLKRVTDLADALVAEAAALKAHYGELERQLDEICEGRDAVAGGRGDAGPAGAEMAAYNLMLSGASRAEVENYLRDAFGLEDTAEILGSLRDAPPSEQPSGRPRRFRRKGGP